MSVSIIVDVHTKKTGDHAGGLHSVNMIFVGGLAVNQHMACIFPVVDFLGVFKRGDNGFNGGIAIGVAACFAWAYHAMGMGDSE